MQVIIWCAKTRQHRRVRDVQHDDALNGHPVHHRLGAKDLLGCTKRGLTDGSAARDFIWVFAGVVDYYVNVAVTVFLEVGFEFF